MNRSAKSTLPSASPIGGMITSSTSDFTMVPNAPPMMIPTARSSTFPRMTKALNSLSIEGPGWRFTGYTSRPTPAQQPVLLYNLVLDLDREPGRTPFREPSGEHPDVAEPPRPEQTRGHRRTRSGLAVHDQRPVPRDLPESLLQVAQGQVQ